MLSRRTLRKYLRYNPSTGEFTWKVARPGVLAGTPAGAKSAGGYTSISLNDVQYKAHRLAFLYMTGKWPKEDVDHINNRKQDNRWSNLRAATRQQNLMNMSPHSDSASGRKGVSWDKSAKSWRARIMFGGKPFDLGLHISIDDAAKAYQKAAKKLFGDYAF
jgi:hypothetical protein